MEIAFCPWAVLAFRAWASKTRQFQRQEKQLDRRLFWPCATNFMFQRVVWQTYQHFFIGEDFSSSRIKTKGCIIREIELKKHSEVFLFVFQSYTTIWWISGLSHCLWKKKCTVWNVLLCIIKHKHTNRRKPAKNWRNDGEKRLISNQSFYPDSSFEQFSSKGFIGRS